MLQISWCGRGVGGESAATPRKEHTNREKKKNPFFKRCATLEYIPSQKNERTASQNSTPAGGSQKVCYAGMAPSSSKSPSQKKEKPNIIHHKKKRNDRYKA